MHTIFSSTTSCTRNVERQTGIMISLLNEHRITHKIVYLDMIPKPERDSIRLLLHVPGTNTILLPQLVSGDQIISTSQLQILHDNGKVHTIL